MPQGASFTKEVNPPLAKLPLNFSGGVAEFWLTFFVKQRPQSFTDIDPLVNLRCGIVIKPIWDVIAHPWLNVVNHLIDLDQLTDSVTDNFLMSCDVAMDITCWKNILLSQNVWQISIEPAF